MDLNNEIKTNPNGANQYNMDPRQILFWNEYNNPKSETFSNAYKSALKAGYSEASATQITTQDWFIEKCRRSKLINKAEKVLDRTLDLEPVDEKGEIKSDILRIQTDVAKHITKTLGKDLGYSERQEHTGKDGKDLIPETLTEEDKEALRNLIPKKTDIQ